MKLFRTACLFLCLAAALPFTLAAELDPETAPDTTMPDTTTPELPDTTVPSIPERAPESAKPGVITTPFSFSWTIENRFLAFNNGDLAALDNSSRATVLATDDRIFVGLARVGMKVKGGLFGFVNVAAEAAYAGYWGNDSLVYGSDHNALYLYELACTMDLARGLLGTRDLRFDLIIGRRFFETYHQDIFKSYVLADTLDALTLDLGAGPVGVELLLDLFSLNSPTDHVYSLKNPRHKYTVDNFDGDVNIFKFGLFPYFKLEEKSGFLRLLHARAFLVHARIGATSAGHYNSGGDEQSGLGFDGNAPDGDSLTVLGGGAVVKTAFGSAMIEVALASGTDYKTPDKPTVEISGLLIHAAVAADLGFAGMDFIGFGLDFVTASGAESDANGNVVNYGFVGLKGSKVGGYLFDKYYGAYPSAIVGYSGLEFEATGGSRRAPVTAIGVSGGIDNFSFTSGKKAAQGGLSVRASFWIYSDTSTAGFDGSLALPNHVYDQRRWGKSLGSELNLKLSYGFADGGWTISAEGGIFTPGEAFTYPVSVADAPYGQEALVGGEISTSLAF